PGGAVFPLFAVAAVAAAPPAAPVWVAALVAGLSATGCVLLGLLGHWAGERHPAAGLAPGQRTLTPGQMAAECGRYAGAALVAGALGLASGLPFPYWAQIAAVVPLSAPGRPAQVERGLHRVVGSTLGIITTGFLLSFPAEAWQLVVWVVILQFLAEMYVLRNYALALLFITPLALLMVQLAHPQPVGAMLQARVLETAIGVAVGIGFVIASALFDRRMAARRARLRKQARQRLRERHATPAYTHGYSDAVLGSHRHRTAENSAAHLLPRLRAGMRLLDVGSGAGTITADLARLVGPEHLTALEVSEQAAAITRAELRRQDLPQVRIVVGDAHDLPFASAEFDVVHAHQVLQHVTNPAGVLGEARRVLRPGGIASIRESDYEGFRWYPDSAGLTRWRQLYLRAARANGGTPDAGRRLLAWAHQAGFTEVTPSAS